MTTRIIIKNDTQSDEPERHRVRVVRGFREPAVLTTDFEQVLEQGQELTLAVWDGREVRITEE